MTTFNTKNQAKRKYYYIAGILVLLLIIVSLTFGSFRKSDNCDPISDPTKSSLSETKKEVKPEPIKYVTLETNSGQVRGQTTKFNNVSVNTFLGIPYAKPPTGALRFESTAPVGQWDGVKDALRPPASCLQNDSPLVLSAFRFLNSTASEDCLYLNIWSPAQEDRVLPVIVYIHGGAFAYGGIATEELEGMALAAEQQVVVVTIQYRLGVLGFLSFESNGPKGNMGLYDQREALKWIHENINRFGGDNDLITVIGHGAGAISTGLHMRHPNSNSYFQRTILQGFGLFWNKHLYSQSLKFSKEFAEQLQCNDVPNVKECLNKVNVDRLLEVQQEILEEHPVAFGPRVPSEFASTVPSVATDTFDIQAAFMFGINSEDDSLFLTTFRNDETELSSDDEKADDEKESRESTDDETTDDEAKEDNDKEEEKAKEEVPKEVPKVEEPKIEEPKVEESKVGEPKEEEPNEEETKEEGEESESKDEEEDEDKDDEPIERSTSKPIYVVSTTTTTTTTTPEETIIKTTTTTTSTSKKTPSSTTSTTTTPSTTTTAAPSSTSTTTTPSTSTTSEASVEKEETSEEPDKESESEEGSEDEGEGEEEAEEEKRRRRKRQSEDIEMEVLCPLLKTMDSIAASNRPVYVYQLSEFSSYHDEIVFGFGYPVKHKGLYDNTEIKYSKHLMKTWAQFATDGDLSETDETWKSYTKENPMFLKMSISSSSTERFKESQCSSPMTAV